MVIPLGSLDVLDIRRRLGPSSWRAFAPFGLDGWRLASTDGAIAIFTVAPYDDGHEWIHASMSRPDRMPSYDDLATLHRGVFGDRWAYQVFPPPANHINIHPRCLHLWGRLDGEPCLPDFTLGGRSI